jgi:hypothetical protein
MDASLLVFSLDGERKSLVYGGQDLKLMGILLLFVGTVAVASAYVEGVPEIEASSTVSALALLSDSLLILKSRRKNWYPNFQMFWTDSHARLGWAPIFPFA